MQRVPLVCAVNVKSYDGVVQPVVEHASDGLVVDVEGQKGLSSAAPQRFALAGIRQDEHQRIDSRDHAYSFVGGIVSSEIAVVAELRTCNATQAVARDVPTQQVYDWLYFGFG